MGLRIGSTQKGADEASVPVTVDGRNCTFDGLRQGPVL